LGMFILTTTLKLKESYSHEKLLKQNTKTFPNSLIGAHTWTALYN